MSMNSFVNLVPVGVTSSGLPSETPQGINNVVFQPWSFKPLNSIGIFYSNFGAKHLRYYNFCGEYRSRTDDLPVPNGTLCPSLFPPFRYFHIPCKLVCLQNIVENIGVEPMTFPLQTRRSSLLTYPHSATPIFSVSSLEFIT